MEAILKENLPFWKALTREQQQFLLDNAQLQQLEKGQFFYYGGGECAGLEIVVKGQVRVFINSPAGGEITLYRLTDGELCILSAACMIRSLDFEIHMEIERDSEICLIPSGAFEALSERCPAVKDFTLELVASRFSDVMWLMNQLVFSNMGQRLAQALLEQSQIQDSDTLSITHEALAKDLGTAREVVTRLLRQFQGDGLVSLSRGAIVLLDRKKLMAL